MLTCQHWMPQYRTSVTCQHWMQQYSLSVLHADMSTLKATHSTVVVWMACVRISGTRKDLIWSPSASSLSRTTHELQQITALHAHYSNSACWYCHIPLPARILLRVIFKLFGPLKEFIGGKYFYSGKFVILVYSPEVRVSLSFGTLIWQENPEQGQRKYDILQTPSASDRHHVILPQTNLDEARWLRVLWLESRGIHNGSPFDRV